MTAVTPHVVFEHSDAFSAHQIDAAHPEQPLRSDVVRLAAERVARRVGER